MSISLLHPGRGGEGGDQVFKKFAVATIISAEIATKNAYGLVKASHRAVFNYTPREGYLYVRSRMISSRCNDNFDEFPPEEILHSWKTAVGKPAFVNHHNEDHKRMRGVIIDAAIHEDTLPDGRPDIWVEALHELDAVRFPKLAEAIIKGKVTRTSMGCDVGFSVCSACGNKATSPAEYCQHIPKMKGKILYKHTASGQREGHLIREICHKISFFENSFLVEDPADPTAVVTGIDQRGLNKAASLQKEAVPEGTRFHFRPSPGSIHAHKIYATVPNGDGRKEIGSMNWHPHNGMVGMISTEPGYERQGIATALWRRAHEVAAERGITAPIHSDVQTPKGKSWADTVDQNPADLTQGQQPLFDAPGDSGTELDQPGPEHTDIRAHLEHEHGMSLRGLNPKMNLDAVHDGQHTYDSMSRFHVHSALHQGEPFRIVPKGGKVLVVDANGKTRGEHDNEQDAKVHQATLYASLPEAGDVTGIQNPERSRDTATEIVRGRMASRKTAETHAEAACPSCAGNDFTQIGNIGVCQSCGDTFDASKSMEQNLANREFSRIREHDLQSQRKQGDELWNNVTPNRTTDYLDRPETARDEMNKAERADMVKGIVGNGLDNSTPFNKKQFDTKKERVFTHAEPYQLPQGPMERRHLSSLREVLAYGETKAPADVDTLRTESCPVCGEADSFDGDRCDVCNFLQPPSMFMDPDTSVAKQMDLEKVPFDQGMVGPNGMPMGDVNDQAAAMEGVPGTPDDGIADLFCPACGFSADTQAPQTNDDPSMPSIEDPATEAIPNEEPEDQQAEENPAADPAQDEDPEAPSGPPEGSQGLVEGDVCPNCEQATMLSPNDIGEMGGEVPQEIAADGDADGIPDAKEQDEDKDGIPDDAEDADQDGVPDDAEPDLNGDGIPDDSEEPDEEEAAPEDAEEEVAESGPVEDEEDPQKGRKDNSRRAYRRGTERETMTKQQPKQAASGAPSEIAELRQIIARQERQITLQRVALETGERKLHYLANLAGVSKEFNAITAQGQKKIADILNPGQPIPDPPDGAPSETTEQAATPETFDDPRNPGITPGSLNGVPAQATDSPLNPGVTLPTSPYGQMVDVTQPVGGTETHVPLDQTKIETDVRVGDPMVGAGTPQGTAFPLNPEFAADGATYANTTNGLGMPTNTAAQRTMASLRLARLRKNAGLIRGTEDEFVVAAGIEKDASLSTAMIEHEVTTLEAVARQRAPRGTGTRPVRQATAERRTPSLASVAVEASAPTGEGFAASDASDLFLDI